MGGIGRRGWMAVAVVMSAAFTPFAFADDGVNVTAVHGTFDDPGFLTGFEGVSPAPPAVPAEGVFHGTSRVYGAAMHGTVSYTLWGSPGNDGTLHFHTVEAFTGFVAGCGRGTMVYRVVGTATSYGPSDPVHQHLQATWTIDAGSGTRGLSGVRSGGGTLDGSSDPTTANSGTITGSVTCTPASPVPLPE
jgi:hypothetical protein